MSKLKTLNQYLEDRKIIKTPDSGQWKKIPIWQLSDMVAEYVKNHRYGIKDDDADEIGTFYFTGDLGNKPEYSESIATFRRLHFEVHPARKNPGPIFAFV